MQDRRKNPSVRFIGFAALAVFAVLAAAAPAEEGRRWTSETTADGYVLVRNADGPDLGYHPSSGVKILTVDGYAFKDLNKNRELDVYEDWRRPTSERARDLAAKMSVEEIAGLMLYSSHQDVTAEVTEAQKQFLVDEHVRAVLIATYSSKADAAKWNNSAQAYAEKIGAGIPINTSSDPRSSTSSGEAYSSGDGDISLWPGNLGFAATFDPAMVKKFGEIASREYRALGIATALSPQIDLATEPRWMRIDGTFGENAKLTADMARAYVDGFQTTPGSVTGWGRHSVNCMIKHWPGDGVTEKGRESHTFAGKYAVYPGKNFEEHLKPFIEGGLKLDGPTGQSSAVMTSYSASYDENKAYGEIVGSGFSKWKITDLLREKYGYDGVVCTDWFITGRMGTTDNLTYEKDGLYQPNLEMLFDSWGISWGLEYGISVVERFYKILEAGADQYGGENSSVPVLAAYKLGVQKVGEAAMRQRFEKSAERLLRNIFNPGLFENPYLDVKETVEIVGREDFMKAGYDAQLASIVMLKNRNNIIRPAEEKRLTVYIPMKFNPAVKSLNVADQKWFEKSPASITPAVDIESAKRYYNVVTDRVATRDGATPAPEDIVRNTDLSGVDFALVAVNSPEVGGAFDYDHFNFDAVNYDKDKGPLNNGYSPISLQYRTYTAPDNEYTRTTIATDPTEEMVWIEAGGEPKTSRGYAGRSTTVRNADDLDLILDTRKAVGTVPVVVFIRAESPMIFKEFEGEVDAILLSFGVSDQAALEVIAGRYEPRGLLPLQMPRDMATVEANYEDVSGDLAVHEDEAGNRYDFGFGLNWSGAISDERTTKYAGR